MVFITKLIKHTFVLFLIANFLVINAFSQTSINGKILDEETNEELIGASVKIVNSSYGCVTDFNGDFVIKTNIPLPFSIEVSYIGYDSKVIDLIDNQRLKVGLKRMESLSSTCGSPMRRSCATRRAYFTLTCHSSFKNSSMT